MWILQLDKRLLLTRRFKKSKTSQQAENTVVLLGELGAELFGSCTHACREQSCVVFCPWAVSRPKSWVRQVGERVLGPTRGQTEARATGPGFCGLDLYGFP